jgi:hypothetical protein
VPFYLGELLIHAFPANEIALWLTDWRQTINGNIKFTQIPSEEFDDRIGS